MSDEGARYRHLIETIQDAVVEFEFVDGEPIVRTVNDAFVETFGYTRAEMCGESLNARIVPDSEADAARRIDERTRSGESTSQQLTRTTANAPCEFLHRSVPCEDDSEIDGIAVYTDITERERAEQKRRLVAETSCRLGEAETLHEGFRTTLKAICAYTEWTYGEVWEPSPTAGELTFAVGYTDDADYEPFREASADITFPVGSGLPGRVYDTGSSEWLEDVTQANSDVFHRTAIADEVGLRAAVGVPVVADDTVVAVLVFFLREGRTTDDALVEHVTDVAWTLGELVARKQAEEVVKRRNRRLETFADVVSHDLRNPLNVADGYLELAREECDSPHLERVESAHERMANLIEDVLTLARQGDVVEDPERFSLADCVHDSWRMIRAPDATLRVETERTVHGDERRVRRLLENLFRNAVEHGGDDVTVTVADLPTGFYVADDGPGIDEARSDAAFEVGHTTRDDGTGFGLSIVQEIADAHRWTVAVTESVDGGARFEFSDVTIEV